MHVHRSRKHIVTLYNELWVSLYKTTFGIGQKLMFSFNSETQPW